VGALFDRRGARDRTAVDVTGECSSEAVWAGRSRRAWIVLLSVMVISLVADLASKSLAFRHVAGQPVTLTRSDILAHTHAGGRDVALDMDSLIPSHQPLTVVPHVLEFTLVLNPGAVFGIGAGKRWVFVAFTGVAITFGLWIFGARTKHNQWLPHVALGLLIGGGLGNLYDRLAFACVRDFIHPLPGSHLPFGIRWPNGSSEIWPYVSNLADLLLLVGIGMLMWHIWRTDPPKKKVVAEGGADGGRRLPVE
jgi:signal peptidase II